MGLWAGLNGVTPWWVTGDAGGSLLAASSVSEDLCGFAPSLRGPCSFSPSRWVLKTGPLWVIPWPLPCCPSRYPSNACCLPLGGTRGSSSLSLGLDGDLVSFKESGVCLDLVTCPALKVCGLPGIPAAPGASGLPYWSDLPVTELSLWGSG